MNEVIKYHNDDFVGFKKYEAKDLSYSVFEEISFYNYVQPVSFFRSDFRGSKFSNVKFYKNNFDRSDFLNSVFINCSFDKVQFGCCQMKNCYFENSSFSNSFYRNTSIHSTTFVNCEFPDEVFLINMQRCKLVNCRFKGCSFEMSTTDNDTFEECTFIDTNLATMHAENHKFIKCKFKNVCIGSSYFFGYSIANCIFEQVFFLYRGEQVPFKELKISEFYKKFEREHRYNDLLNLLVSQKASYQIPDILNKCLIYYNNMPYGRMLDIFILFQSLSFAAIYETIDFTILDESLNILSKIDLSKYNFEERSEIRGLFTKLQNSIYLCPHSDGYLARIDTNRKSLLNIKLFSDDYDKCINIVNTLLDSISDKKYWTLVEKQKGSWILVFSVSTMVLLAALPHIVKNYSDVYFEIKTKKMLSQKLIEKIEDADSLLELEKLALVTKKTELLMPAGKCINKDISKEIASITANI